jgi:putative oxidoreductase
MSFMQRMLATKAPRAVVLIRVLVGGVFLSEGIQKFLFPDILGVGRFTKIGIPAPELTAPFIGGVEVVFGTMLLLGLLTRLAAVPLLIDIMVALISTKLPILLGQGFWIFNLPKVTRYGFWGAASEARTDLSMLLGLLFLLVVGAGAWSLDATLALSRDAER